MVFGILAALFACSAIIVASIGRSMSPMIPKSTIVDGLPVYMRLRAL